MNIFDYVVANSKLPVTQKISDVFEFATDAETEIANKTSRTSGAVGSRAIVPRYVQSIANRKEFILDFGSGKDAAHANMLKRRGFKIEAYDFGSNVKAGVHAPDALSRQHDLTYASNVLNTQSSPAMMKETLRQIFGATKNGGRVVANFPTSPRKMPTLAPEKLERLLSQYGSVKRVGGTKQAPMWLIVKGASASESVDEAQEYYRGSKNKRHMKLRLSTDRLASFGKGVYLTTNPAIASEYGKYVSTVVPTRTLKLRKITPEEKHHIVDLFDDEQKEYIDSLLAGKFDGLLIPEWQGDGDEIVIYDPSLLTIKTDESVNEAELPKHSIKIREPWATKLLDGVKTIETATFSLPDRFKDVPLYVRNENQDITGIIKFSGSKKYQSAEEFEADSEKHGLGKADRNSPYHFNNRIRTYGWFISYAEKFDIPLKGKPGIGQFRFQPTSLAECVFEYKFPVKTTGGDKPWPKTTWVINMCSAHDCPSRKAGMCQLGQYGDVAKTCYAHKAEHMRPVVLAYRRRQEQQWSSMSGDEIADDIVAQINAARIKPNIIRFSESGDFRSQEDVEKMSTIANKVRAFGVKVVGFTARKDLDFSNVPENLIINGSNFTAPGIANVSKAVSSEEFKNLPAGAIKCKGECGGSSKGCGTCFKKGGATSYAEVKVPKNEATENQKIKCPKCGTDYRLGGNYGFQSGKNVGDRCGANIGADVRKGRGWSYCSGVLKQEHIHEEVVTHDHSNTQIPVPHEIAEEVIAFGLAIPDEEIYTDPADPSMGRELTPHITIKWGLVTEDPNEVESLIEDGAEQFTVTLGKVSIFSKEDKPYDVVKVDVRSEELTQLHNKFSSLKNDDENPEYAPHMTIAYVTKGAGQKYIGRTEFEGKQFLVDCFDFKDQHGNSKQLMLNNTGGN